MIRYLIAGAIGMLIVAATSGFANAGDGRAHGFAQPLVKPMVAGIQEDLAELGYYTGPVNGELNAGTAAAIRLVQKAAGVDADGRADQEIANMLNFAEVPPHDGPALTASGTAAQATQQADKAPARPKTDPYLKAAQKKLKAMGLYDGAIDGLMGPKSEQALIDFRVEQGLKGPARLTPELLAAIMSAQPAAAETGTTPDTDPTPDGARTPEPDKTDAATPDDTAPVTTSTGDPAPAPRPHMTHPDDAPAAGGPEAEAFQPMPEKEDGDMPTDATGDPAPETGARQQTPPPGSQGRAGHA